MLASKPLTVSSDDVLWLEQLSRSRSAIARSVERARMLLLCVEGRSNDAIAEQLCMDARTVSRWRRRAQSDGVRIIERDAPRTGRPVLVAADVVKMVVEKTTTERPEHATHWSTRTMAQATGISASTIRRIWHTHGLKPHLVRTFKVSTDPMFVEKLHDIIGLYLAPPEHALVYCVDEKSQIQALDRTQPGLPMKRGRAQTMTHDYKRNGTTTLFAALNTLDGSNIACCQKRHRHEEWLKFLRLINRSTPKGKEIHLIADNYATHKHPNVKQWLEKHPRFHMHFTPTSASWLNMVERLFRDLTDKCIRRGVFHSVEQLTTTILDYMKHQSENPKPIIWTKKANDVLEKVQRAQKALDMTKTTGALH